MNPPERLSVAITTHSKLVVALVLVATLVVGAGITALDDDSSLEQFETDSPEAEAAEYAAEHFGGTENETTVQLITRGDDVLTRDSLDSSLAFQQRLHENETINATLVDDDPITGVENVLAITAIRQEEAEDLEARAGDLENRSEAIENRSAALEARGAALEDREAELNETTALLTGGLNESRDIEREQAELDAAFEAGEIDESTYRAESAALADEREQTIENATAGLGETQREQYEETVDAAAEIERQRVLLEAEYGDAAPEQPEYQELLDQLDDVYTAGTVGVLEDEYEALEDDANDLEADQDALEADVEDLEDDQEALEDDQAELEDAETPSLASQREAITDLDEDDFDELLTNTLSGNESNDVALALMPTDYEPGSTAADARMTMLTQDTEGTDVEIGATDESALDAQLDIHAHAIDHEHDHVVFGAGIITDEIDRSMADSLAIVGPLALLLVVAALLVAYRDLLDIVLGVTGILIVLVWTFGFMGWAGIAFNQMFVAIPVLLIGLSIDYAIHVFMRHREHQEPGRSLAGIRASMLVALTGVGVALVWVTATTVIGFLSNLISPIEPIREFGIVSSVGILAALVVFGALIPAAKVELDTLLERIGLDRQKRAFGTGGGSRVLTVGAVAARRAPMAVLLAVLLVTAGGVYGATQVDTSFEQEDFLAEDPPGWTDHLGPFSPGEYHAKEDMEFVNERFQRDDVQAQLLVTGAVDDDETLDRVNATESAAADGDVVYTLPTGDADVQSPLATIDRVADENESFADTVGAADTTGDGVPDENVTAVYDELFEVDEDAASQVIHREDGSYEAIRLVIAVEGDAGFGETTDEMRALANTFEANGTAEAGTWDAIATGDPVVGYIVESDLMETVIQSLVVALVAVIAFLSVAYWITGNGATLGAVTLLPVALAVSWILGTMYLIGMPFNVLTGMITSLTIGLGVAYSIHISARYTLELERQGDVWAAMETTVTGTGGALLGSAATTICGFGTLALAILPVLRQFGIITGLTILYAFLASVLVLPTLLIYWTRFAGPGLAVETDRHGSAAPTAGDGGQPLSQDCAPEDERSGEPTAPTDTEWASSDTSTNETRTNDSNVENTDADDEASTSPDDTGPDDTGPDDTGSAETDAAGSENGGDR